MKDISEMSLEELGAYVCTHLEKENIFVTLSGGSAVEIYSNGKYTSWDLDFIDMFGVTNKKYDDAMKKIGFQRDKINKYFTHEDTDYFIEFPPGPLAVGEQDITLNETTKINTNVGELRILTPTDCVKDRLAGYFYFNDEQNLEQAKAILKEQYQSIDYNQLEKWLIKERRYDW